MATAPDPQEQADVRVSGSLSRRMILIAAAWIALLLAGGGFALDRVLTTAITSNFDNGIEYMLTSLIVSDEIGPDGEVIFKRALADQPTLDPYSVMYCQVSARGHEDFPRSDERRVGKEHVSTSRSGGW